MDVSRELCRSAQFQLLPDRAYELLLGAISSIDIEDILGILIMDELAYADRPTKVSECLQRLCELPNPQTCQKICKAPAQHFLSKTCAPIGEVFDRLAPLVHNVHDILTDSIIEELYSRINPDSDFSDDKEYTLYDLRFTVKKVAVLFWPNVTLVTEQNRELLFRRWSTLRENLNLNFQLMMPLPDSSMDCWDQYLMHQLEQADVVVVGPTAALFHQYAHDEEYTVANRSEDWSSQQIESAFLLDLLRGRFNLSALPTDRLTYQRQRPLPPIVIALAESNCNEAYSMSGFVYRLPSDTEFLLRFVYGIYKICAR